MQSEEEKELEIKMDKLANERLERALNNLDNPNIEEPDPENLSLVFTYKNTANLVKLSENLVRSTDKLKCWTIAIAVLTFVMICTTIANIVVAATQQVP